MNQDLTPFFPESPNPEEIPSPDDPVLMGIMAEIISEELSQENIQVPFLEFPAQSEMGSEKRRRFWTKLEQAVVPIPKK